jgi:hypothetical protein
MIGKSTSQNKTADSRSEINGLEVLRLLLGTVTGDVP